jgi:hypothetical protein
MQADVFYQVLIMVAGGKRASWPDSYSNAKDTVLRITIIILMTIIEATVECLVGTTVALDGAYAMRCSVVSRYKHLTMEFSMRQIEFLKNKSISIGAKNDAMASASNMVGRQA